MSYDPARLVALSYANGCTLWHYGRAAVGLAVAQAELGAATCRAGDVVIVAASDGARVLVITASGSVAMAPDGAPPPVRTLLLDEPPPIMNSPVAVSGIFTGVAPAGIRVSVLQGAATVAGPVAATLGAGSFTASVSVAPGTGYRLRAEMADDSGIFDLSNESFDVPVPPAAQARVTEGGDRRVTEANDLRIVE